MKKCILVSSILSLMVACSSNSDSSGSVNPAQVADTGTQSDLNGTWSQACQAGAFTGAGFSAMAGAGSGATPDAGTGTGAGPGVDAGAGAGAGAGTGPSAEAEVDANAGVAAATQNFLQVRNDEMTMVTRAYPAADCTGEALAEARVEFDYSIQEYMAAQNNNADMRLQSANLVMKSQEAVDAANAASLCGMSNWQVNDSRDIEGTSCLQNMPSSSGRRFFQTLNYQNGSLSFGILDADAGTTDENRPKALSPIPFSRNDQLTDIFGDTDGDGQGQQDQDQKQEEQQQQEQDKDQDQGQQEQEDRQQEDRQQEDKQQEKDQGEQEQQKP